MLRVCFGLALFSSLWFAAPDAEAATYYIAPSGGADAGPGTSASPWATFAHAFGAMSGGDTLIVKDGTYAQQIRDIPSGRTGAYTTVKAEHDGRATIIGSADACLDVGGSYIQIEGMQFDGRAVRGVAIVSGADHVKLLRCAFYGAVCRDNTAVVSAGPNSSDILFEDCWAFGCGRYKFVAYESQRVVFRRCVARHDYHVAADDQCATFTNYDANDVVYQNCVAIDSMNEPGVYGNNYGGVWFEKNNHAPTDPPNNISVVGSIFLNVDTTAFNDPKIYGAHAFRDDVVWHSRGGMEFLNIYEDWLGHFQPSVDVKHVTMGDVYGAWTDQTPFGIGFTGLTNEGHTYSGFPAQVTDSLMVRLNVYGIGSDIRSDYNDLYGNAANYQSCATCKGAGPHDRQVDPGLRYIVRIEPDSPLKGAASDGGDVGANVLQRIGVSGTLHGEPGWDQVTSEPLWPFPNEARIKADMGAWTNPVDAAIGPPGARGFCAPGTARYGGSISLTSYVWEYLGNACPQEICGTATRAAPSTPTALAAVAGDRQVGLTWSASSGAGLAGYKVYVATSASGSYAVANPSGLVSATSYTVTGLAGSTTYWFKVSSLNGYGDESSLSAAVSATPTGTGGGSTGGGASGGCSSSSGAGAYPALFASLALLARGRRRGMGRDPGVRGRSSARC